MKREGIKLGGKRGQVTIFIIIAIAVVSLAALFYTFYPQIKSAFTGETRSPQAFIQNCLEEELSNAINEVSIHGGEINPEFYYQYKLDKLKYLCYTNEYYKLCTVQEPMLKAKIEEEIQKAVSQTAFQCFEDLKKDYQNRGYSVTLNKGREAVELRPQKVAMIFNHSFTLIKESSQTVLSFEVLLDNNLYEFAEIATYIIGFETTYGDSETTLYMDNYRNLKVEKIKQDDGTKVYILTDRNNNQKFQFASRSMAWKPGYSWEQ